MDILDPLEKILDLAVTIKELVELFKGKDKYFETCDRYMSSIVESMTEYKKNRPENKKVPEALLLLQEELDDFREFLFAEKNRSNFAAFLRGNTIVREAQDKMENIESQIHNFNLAVNVENQNETNANFKKLFEEGFNAKNIVNKFGNKDAGAMWVVNFNQEEQVDWKEFNFAMKRFSEEKLSRVLTDNELELILYNIDTNQDHLIRFDEWDEFYDKKWSVEKERIDLLNSKPEIVKKADLTFNNCILKLTSLSKQVKPTDTYPVGHIFKFSDEKTLEFKDYKSNEVVKAINWERESVIFGREGKIMKQKAKVSFIPDVYFNPKSGINMKQFQISYKKYAEAGFCGFYVNNLSNGEPTCLKVETKPFVIQPDMIFMLSGHYVKVEKITPMPGSQAKTSDEVFYVSFDPAEDTKGEKATITKPVSRRKQKQQLKADAEEAKKEEGDDKEGASKEPAKKKKKKKASDEIPAITLRRVGVPSVTFEAVMISGAKKKEKMNVAIGSDSTCGVVIKELPPFQMKVKFDPFISTWIAVTDETCTLEDSPSCSSGNYIVLIEGSDFFQGEDSECKAGSLSVKLKRGMKIAYDYNEIEVMEDGT